MNIVFQKQFNEQLFNSERRRTIILIGIFLFGICYQAVNVWLIKQSDEESDQVQSFATKWLFPVLLIIFELSFLIYLHFISRKKQKQLSIFAQYINVMLEISLLSFFIISVARQHPSYNVLQSAPIYIFFLFIILSTLRLNFGLSFFCGSLAAVFYIIIGCWIYDEFTRNDTLRVIILFLSGIAAGLVARQIKAGISFSLSEIEKRHKVENLFGQQISKEVAEKMMKDEGNIESRRMNVAVMFIDIRNFTQFSIDKTPEDIVQYQNDFLAITIGVISRNGGIVNQILGDGCMVTFGAPVEIQNPSQLAVSAGMELLKAIEDSVNTNKLLPTRVGIGIHTGEAVTGNIGTAERKQYSISGSVVILASRIEQLNKEFSSQLLISGDVADCLDAAIRKEVIGDVMLKGWTQPVTIFKLA